jgi:hypothetical protein
VAAFWVTERVRPAIVTVPMRDVVAVFGATVTLTVPLPEPDPPAVIESHPAPLAALQVQPLPAVTDTAMVSPAAGEVRVAGEME